MSSRDAAALLNLIGFMTGAWLYAMLLVMILRTPRVKNEEGSTAPGPRPSREYLLIATSVLGLLWTLGSLANFVLIDLAARPPQVLITVALIALGFLPAVVVHSVLSSRQIVAEHKKAFWLIIVAYVMSTVAAIMQIGSVALGQTPSRAALLLLTLSFSALIVPLMFLTRRQPGWSRAWSVIALSIFAVSALHLSEHDGEHYSWLVELIGHHASLPLVVAILYQDYRFALADIFLKRALTFIMLVAVAFGFYMAVATRALSVRDGHISSEPVAVVALLGMWVTTALVYPALRHAVSWFVDRLVLRRADYETLRLEIQHLVLAQETAETVLDETCGKLESALTACEVVWFQYHPPSSGLGAGSDKSHILPLFHSVGAESNQSLYAAAISIVNEQQRLHDHRLVLPAQRGACAMVVIPTTELPRYALIIGQLKGGRRLLPHDVMMLESVALIVARRLDTLRIIHERCEQNLREQQISKLATEAQLRALRAQINPHFLFNALTTIGYLIQTAPDRALDTLMRLTGLLRTVLRSSGEFVTLGEEVSLVETYLDIERARFEERLRVSINVAQSLKSVSIPSLLIQPLVENAIKHGITPNKMGGDVMIRARVEALPEADILCITVRDTGAGKSQVEMARGRKRGLGISNVEQRLKNYYGNAASLSIESARHLGTAVEIRLPVKVPVESSAPAAAADRKRA